MSHDRTFPSDIEEIIASFVKQDLYVEHMASKVSNNPAFLEIAAIIEDGIRNFLWCLVEHNLSMTYSNIIGYFYNPTIREELLFSNRFHTIRVCNFLEKEVFWFLMNNQAKLKNHAYNNLFHFLLHCIIDDMVLPYEFFFNKICHNSHAMIIDRFMGSMDRYECFMTCSTNETSMAIPYIMEFIVQDMLFDNEPFGDIETVIRLWFKNYSNIHLLIPKQFITRETIYELVLRQFIYCSICSNTIEYWYGWHYENST